MFFAQRGNLQIVQSLYIHSLELTQERWVNVCLQESSQSISHDYSQDGIHDIVAHKINSTQHNEDYKYRHRRDQIVKLIV